MLKNLTKHFPKNCITFSTDSPLNSANAAAKLVISSSGYVCRVLKTICLQSALSSSCSHISSPYSNCNENFIVPSMLVVFPAKTFSFRVCHFSRYFLKLQFSFFWKFASRSRNIILNDLVVFKDQIFHFCRIFMATKCNIVLTMAKE